jgi:hypothetical protein
VPDLTSPAPGLTAPRFDQNSSTDRTADNVQAPAGPIDSLHARVAVQSNQPFWLKFGTADTLLGNYLRRLDGTGFLRQLEGLDLQVIIQLLLRVAPGGELSLADNPIVAAGRFGLAESTGYSPTPVASSVRRLIEAHLIARLAGLPGDSNRYEILPPVKRHAPEIEPEGSLFADLGDAFQTGVSSDRARPVNENSQGAPCQRKLTGRALSPNASLADSAFSAQKRDFTAAERALSTRPSRTRPEFSAVAVVADLKKSAAAAEENLQIAQGEDAFECSDEMLDAIELLKKRGVDFEDALDILTDPEVKIAEEFLAEIIRKLTPKKPPRTPGGWWRNALRKYQRFGADPAAARIRDHAAKPAPTPAESQGFYEKEGFRLIAGKSEDELRKIFDRLIAHYRGNEIAISQLNAMEDPPTDLGFWRAVGKNPNLVRPTMPAKENRDEAEDLRPSDA